MYKLYLKYSNDIYTLIKIKTEFSFLYAQALISDGLSRIINNVDYDYTIHIERFLNDELGLSQTLCEYKDGMIMQLTCPYDLNINESIEQVQELYPNYVYPYDKHPCGDCAYYGECNKLECEYRDTERIHR